MASVPYNEQSGFDRVFTLRPGVGRPDGCDDFSVGSLASTRALDVAAGEMPPSSSLATSAFQGLIRRLPMPATHTIFIDLIPASSKATVSYDRLQQMIHEVFPDSAGRSDSSGVRARRTVALAYEWDFWDKSRGIFSISVRPDPWIDHWLTLKGIPPDYRGELCMDAETVIPYFDYPDYTASLWRETLQALARLRPLARISAWGMPRKHYWQWSTEVGRNNIREHNSKAFGTIDDLVGSLSPEVYPPNNLSYSEEECFEYSCKNLDEAARLARPRLLGRLVGKPSKAIIPFMGPMVWSADASYPVANLPDYLIEYQIASILFMGHTRSCVWGGVLNEGQARGFLAACKKIQAWSEEIRKGGSLYDKWSVRFAKISSELPHRPR